MRSASELLDLDKTRTKSDIFYFEKHIEIGLILNTALLETMSVAAWRDWVGAALKTLKEVQTISVAFT